MKIEETKTTKVTFILPRDKELLENFLNDKEHLDEFKEHLEKNLSNGVNIPYEWKESDWELTDMGNIKIYTKTDRRG